MTIRKAEAIITGENQWTSPTDCEVHGVFNLSISGTSWVATVTFQRSFDQGVTWVDTTTFTSNVQMLGTEPETAVWHRAGVKTGEFTSGTIYVRISQ
jgi:hypothetical protein